MTNAHDISAGESIQPVREPHRLCVAFLDCTKVARQAATFLVLSQNRLQRVFEFSVFDLDRMRTKLAKEVRAMPASRLSLSDDEIRALNVAQNENSEIDEYVERSRKIVGIAQRYIQREVEAEDLHSTDVPRKWVIFTEMRFANEFYESVVGDIAVVSLGDWKRKMAPPSAFEFILSMTQAVCAEFFIDPGSSHYFTKGCLFDYNEFIDAVSSWYW